jgi:AhpD family alkylhydroperoxidase
MRAAMRRLALDQIRYLTPARSDSADPLVGRVYRQVEREFGVLAPPVALHSPAPEAMAAGWLILRETLLAPGLVGRPVKEAVACGVSLANACPYCVTVHGATLRGLAGGRAAALIGADRIDELRDPAVRAAAAWARGIGRVAGRAMESGTDAPFPLEEAPEYVGVAATFHYINRMVNTFLEDAPMPPSAPRRGLPVVERVLSAMIRAARRRIGPAGAALDLLPAADPDPDLVWSAGNPSVEQAFARAAAALERAGRRSVPEPVRELVFAELAAWDGRPKGLSRSWIEQPLAALGPVDRPAGRLALLVALASYQIDGSVVEDFRRVQPDDAQLVETAAWAALTAARRAVGALPWAKPVGSVAAD